MSNLNADWTPAESDYAIKHWQDGKSANRIAVMMNAAFGTSRSRNSVIGRLNRLGLARAAPSGPRESTLFRKAARAACRAPRVNKTPTARKLSPPKPLPAPVVILADVSFARPWLERGPRQCAFPLGERHAVMCCCFPTEETYCEAHRKAMGGTRRAWSPKDHRNVARAA